MLIMVALDVLFWYRQELVRRNAFDIDEKTCNYKTMLQRLMIELVKEEEELAKQRVLTKEEEYIRSREQAKAEREKKKQEALLRSQARQQSDPNYFANRKAVSSTSSDLKNIVDSTSATSDNSQSNGNKIEVIDNGENDEDPFKDNNKNNDDDIFRAYKPSGRTKVFVK